MSSAKSLDRSANMAVVGCSVGPADEGRGDGCIVGTGVGLADGFALAVTVGNAVGGEVIGAADGKSVGVAVDTDVGLADGLALAVVVGNAVGGEVTGATDGKSVGVAVSILLAISSNDSIL